MIDQHIFNPKSPKYYIRKYLEKSARSLANKIVIDIPAGNGATTEMLLNLGARVEAYDLFPEYFLVKETVCQRADILSGIPVNDDYADMAICQEGIEHFSDQLKVFKEYNRILKTNGLLLLTCPSYSNLAAKFSYLLFESETFKQMPPNEIDDIWMSDKTVSAELYHGHIFLIGLQKLRILGKLAGFNIREIKYMRLSKASLLLFPFFYLLILIRSLLTYNRNMRKDKGMQPEAKKTVYKEQLHININPKNLLNKHTFIVFEKEKNTAAVDFRNELIIKQFGEIM